MTGHEIGKKFGVVSEFVLAVQEYFGFLFSLSFGHPNDSLSVPVPFFGLTSGARHAAISHPE